MAYASPHQKGDKQEPSSVPTDLNRAGVLRVVQQSHGAVAFPVQTPDAAAHQSAQHLFDCLRTGPDTSARRHGFTFRRVSSAPAPCSNTWSAAVRGGGGGASFHQRVSAEWPRSCASSVRESKHSCCCRCCICCLSLVRFSCPTLTTPSLPAPLPLPCLSALLDWLWMSVSLLSGDKDAACGVTSTRRNSDRLNVVTVDAYFPIIRQRGTKFYQNKQGVCAEFNELKYR